jgi:stress-induced morphogen
MNPEQIQSAIEAALPGARVLVRDLTGTGDHYQAVVGSEAFAGKSLIEQHQMVYKALGSAVGNAIHALALKTCTLDEFEAAAAG